MTGIEDEYFCGCCGGEIRGSYIDPERESEWCSRCITHIAPRTAERRAPWDRTYFAVHRQPCPYEETA